jgi:hypothetical protein
MADDPKDVEHRRATMREELADNSELADEEARDEASFAPPGHLGERMTEAERRERL